MQKKGCRKCTQLTLLSLHASRVVFHFTEKKKKIAIKFKMRREFANKKLKKGNGNFRYDLLVKCHASNPNIIALVMM